MSRIKRKIIHIDEDKCDGCGICAEACHEGAIQMTGGKARLVKESYCDGLGDCIGPCPRGAISIEERPAEEYDEQAVKEHLSRSGSCPASCPGSVPLEMPARNSGTAPSPSGGPRSRLTTWPVQITLVPARAPFLRNADLLVAADCVPFAFAGFHEKFVKGRVVLTGCPKLDDAEYYLNKLGEIFRLNRIGSVTVPYMEVPCCGGLPRIVESAIRSSGREIPLELVRIGIDGDVQETRKIM